MDNFKIFKNEIHILFPSPPRSSPGLSTRLTPGPSPRPTPGLPPHQLTRPPGWPLLVGFTIECSRRALIEYKKEKRIKNETEMIKEIKKSLT